MRLQAKEILDKVTRSLTENSNDKVSYTFKVRASVLGKDLTSITYNGTEWEVGMRILDRVKIAKQDIERGKQTPISGFQYDKAKKEVFVKDLEDVWTSWSKVYLDFTSKYPKFKVQ